MCGISFDAHFKVFMHLYTVMYFPIMIIPKSNFHNLFNVVQRRNLICKTFCIEAYWLCHCSGAVLLTTLTKSNTVPKFSFHVS